jgi:nicotinamide phosphoribosyltransferase
MVDFVLNDFGFRGVSSVQSAKTGGSAHLVNFLGSDTVIASKLIRDVYNTERIYGLSIPATEHSIMTLKGEAGELELMKRVLTTFPTGLVACVSDSFNIFRACSEYWGTELRDLVLSRPATPGNQLVIRPDSGHVTRTLVEVFNILFDKFGYTVNEKGYKVLPPQVRVIQGDGVNLDSIQEIYDILKAEKISPENLALGMGGKLLQADINRDTNNFATKACSAVVDGVEVDVVKSPTEMDENGNITKSFKKSKKGKLKLVKNEDGSYRTVTSSDPDFDTVKDELVEVFRNGVITKEWTFEEVRDRAKVETQIEEMV